MPDTQEWEHLYQSLVSLIRTVAKCLPNTMFMYHNCMQLKQRYTDGERTEELREAIAEMLEAA